MVTFLACQDDFWFLGKRVRDGDTVVYPTDTVFGLGSNPESEIGVSRCFELKSREKSKPMPVLFSTLDMLKEFVELDQRARIAAEKFWPGQLTLILPLKRKLPNALTRGERKLGVRIPDHHCCLKLIESCGGSLIGTSANLSGEGPFADLEDEAFRAFCAKADFFVSGECGGRRLSSTVVDLSSPDGALLVREGAISIGDISTYLSNIKRTDLSRRYTSNCS